MTRRKKRKRLERSTHRERIQASFAKIGTIKGTARALSIRPHTVRRAIRPKDPEPPPAKGAGVRPSKLDPFRPVLKRLILEDHLTAILALGELKQLGYAGGYSILKEYVKQIRPARVRPTTFFEHPPGEGGQVDWSPYRVFFEDDKEERIVHAFSMAVAFSRYLFVRFALDEQLETIIRLHEEAFADLKGVPSLISYDNMTTVGRHISQDEVWLNPRFLEYSKRCGFDTHLIAPGKPNQHAIVERPFLYVENNCLRRRRFRFRNFVDLNQHATWWCDSVANVRVHGTTRERPVDRLLRERSFLKPLPDHAHEPFRALARKVATDFCVRVGNNRYSTWPKHVGKPATVQLYKDRLEILVEGEITAAHPLAQGSYQRLVLPEHENAFRKMAPQRELLEQAFFRLGAVAKDYYEGLRVQRGRGAGYHMQRILRLADRHGAQVTTGAMAYAARHGNFNADAVARVIAGRPMPRVRKVQQGPEPLSPERAKRWVEGMDVEQRRLEDFDRLIDRKAALPEHESQAPENGNDPPEQGGDPDGQA